MSIRRWLALALFLFSLYWFVVGVIAYRSDERGYAALAGLLVAGSAGVGMLLAASLAFAKSTLRLAEDSGFGLVPERAKAPIAAAVVALFGAAMWLIAIKGLLGGRIDAFGKNAMRVAWSTSPLKFGLYVALWCLAGAGCMGLAWFLARQPARGPRSDAAGDSTLPMAKRPKPARRTPQP